MNPRQKLDKEIEILQRMIPLMEAYGHLSHGLDADLHLALYRDWLAEAIAERKAL
jgi:hypothetical protein